MDQIIYNGENSVIMLENDYTCVKRVFLPKCFERLDNEAKCLEKLGGYIAPKLIGYNKTSHELRMEYINGLTLVQYINKYGKIPRYFFAKIAKYLLELLDKGIEYGADMKLIEHFIIIEENNDVRIIDFGISDIYEDRSDIIDFWKNNYKREFAFVFEDSKTEDVEKSKEDIYRKLSLDGISKDIVDLYFEDYDKI